MGIEWLNGIAEILRNAGFRTGEAFPTGKRMESEEAVAAVGLRNLNCREGTAEFEIRILSPRRLGGWHCQNAAAEAVTALENNGIACRMEPMSFRNGCDCFEMVIIGQKQVIAQQETPAAEVFRITVGNEAAQGVTVFQAEQDRGRRLIGTLNQRDPVGVTRGTGGWKIRLVQEILPGGTCLSEPEEPFTLWVQEQKGVTRFSGCCWNRVAKSLERTRTKIEWEGFALTRTESVSG